MPPHRLPTDSALQPRTESRLRSRSGIGRRGLPAAVVSFTAGRYRPWLRGKSREHHAGDRHRDVGDQDAGDRRAGRDPGLGVGRVSLQPSSTRLVGAGPRALVGRDGEHGARGPEPGGPGGLGNRRDRPERADARLGLPRRRGRGDPPRLALERPADRGRVRRDRGEGGGARGPDPDGRQPGADRLHRAEVALAPQPRAEGLGAGPPGPPAQGLHPLPPDRDVCDRGQRRLGHAAARRRPPTLEHGAPRQAGARPRDPAAMPREPRGLGAGRAPSAPRRPGSRRGRPSSAAGATSPRARWATGSSGRAWSRPRWGPRASSSPTPRASVSTPWAASSAAVMRCRGRGTTWGSSSRPAGASSGSATSWARPRSRKPGAGDRPLCLARRGGRAGRGRVRGALLPAVSDRREDPAFRPRRQGGLDRPDRPARPASPRSAA